MHASVLDKEGQYQLFITKNGIEHPDAKIIIPDILVQTYATGDKYQFAFWDDQYWFMHENKEAKIDKMYAWSRLLTLKTRERFEESNHANYVSAYNELMMSSPLN